MLFFGFGFGGGAAAPPPSEVASFSGMSASAGPAKRSVTLDILVSRFAGCAAALRFGAIETLDFPAQKVAWHSHLDRENSLQHTGSHARGSMCVTGAVRVC